MRRTLGVTQALLFATVVLGAGDRALAQAGSVIAVPMTSNVAGVAAGGPYTACTTGLANIAGVTTYGDGCPATQATLTTTYDVQVDAAGDLYMGENAGADHAVRVVYNGGATLKAMLVAANPFIPNFNPVVGAMYTLAGGEAAALTATSGVYYCGNIVGGIQALNSEGDGCPAAESYVKVIGVAVDQYGNVYAASTAGKPSVRVVYVGGQQVANLIQLLNGVAPQVGYIYTVVAGSTAGTEGDGGLATRAGLLNPRYVTVSPEGDIYVADGTSTSVVNGNTINNSGNNVRMVNGTTGIITTVAGETTCASTYTASTGCPYGYSGDGGPATQALFNSPYVVFLDRYENLFIVDTSNLRVRVVYRGGTLAGIASPVVGNVYTYAGGGTSTTTGATTQLAKFSSLSVGGIDKAGNVYVYDSSSRVIWKFDAITGTGVLLSNGTSATGAAKLGIPCNNVTGAPGPVSTDNYADGCPATQTYISSIGTISFDSHGNFYIASNTNSVVQKFSYNTQIPATADGASASQAMAFYTEAAVTLTGEAFTLQGAATTEFTNAVTNNTCTTNGSLSIKTTCVLYVKFTPAHDGLRSGTIQLNTASATAVSEGISGIGLGAGLAVDPGTKTTLGSGIKPGGAVADQIGNVLVADTQGNEVLKGASSGTSLTAVITSAAGLSHPSAVAVDGFGNLYVADTGNNRILKTTSTGTVVASLGSGLSGPSGIAVDRAGNIYVADTGNNRIVVLQSNGYQLPLPVSGLSAPAELTADLANNLYILDSGNARIVEYSEAAGQNVVALDAGVVPAGMAVDPAGDLFVADSAGLDVIAYPGGALPGNVLLTGLTTPVSLAADADANLFIADTANSGLLELRRTLGNIAFPYTDLASTTQESIALSNVGNAGLVFPAAPLTTITGANASLFSIDPSTTNGCGLGNTYVAGSGCNFTASFAPTVPVNAMASAAFNTNAANTSAVSAVLSGPGLALTPTTTQLGIASPTGSTVYYSQSVTVTATLVPTATTTTPTGTYTFTIDGRTQSPESLAGGATAALTLSLPVGTHGVCATYSGSTTYGSSSLCDSFTVNKAVTTTALTGTPVNTNGLLTLLLTATMNSTTATGETGTVTFYAGSVVLAVVPVSAINGVVTATYTSATLSFASNVLTATYSGNANFLGSTSTAIPTNGGDFAIGSASPTLSIPQGGNSFLSFTVASLYGGSGSITPSCSGLPSNSVCRFLPVTIPVGTTPVIVQALIWTNVPSNIASNDKTTFGRGVFFAAGLPLALGLLLRRRRSAVRLLMIMLLSATLAATLSACSTPVNQTFSGLVTPAGSYPITFVFTGTNGLATTHTATATVVVITNTGPQ